jgi:hypothetical protein
MKDEHVRSVGYIASRKLAMWEDNNKMELRWKWWIWWNCFRTLFCDVFWEYDAQFFCFHNRRFFWRLSKSQWHNEEHAPCTVCLYVCDSWLHRPTKLTQWSGFTWEVGQEILRPCGTTIRFRTFQDAFRSANPVVWDSYMRCQDILNWL